MSHLREQIAAKGAQIQSLNAEYRDLVAQLDELVKSETKTFYTISFTPAKSEYSAYTTGVFSSHEAALKYTAGYFDHWRPSIVRASDADIARACRGRSLASCLDQCPLDLPSDD
jgi:hypothetical protein